LVYLIFRIGVELKLCCSKIDYDLLRVANCSA